MLALIADAASHDSIYAAVLSGMALILVAIIGLYVSTRRGRTGTREELGDKVDDVRMHLPPNGERLYLMVEATNRSVNHMRDKLDHVEDTMLRHLVDHDREERDRG